MLSVLLQGSIGVNQDIVNISGNKYIQVLSEDGVNKRLEHRWCIRKAEWHNSILVMPVPRTKGCLPFFAIFHPNQVESTSDVELGKPLGSLDSVLDFRY